MTSIKLPDSLWMSPGYGKMFQGFQDLMKFRIRNILLVSSLYDLYLFEEDGRLYELIREEYRGLNLSHAPELTRVSSGMEALRLAKEEKRFDLIITTPHIEDMEVSRFAKMVRNSDLDMPIVLLTYDNRETSALLSQKTVTWFDRVFIWQGDYRILIGIIKYLEDSVNVEEDTANVGVQVIILVEDNVRFYSSYLPLIYTEIFNQAKRLISEGINLSDKYLRMRARPKILLCTTYEDAWYNFEKYKDYVLGIISDIDFMRDGKQDPEAGIEFARAVKKRQHDIPILLQSNSLSKEQLAYQVNASFLLKNSLTLLNDLRKFMIDNFGFGDFVFKSADDKEVGRAYNLLSLEKQLAVMPEESIRYHADHNHFSKWLKARTEFWLAHKIRPRRVSEFKSVNDLRDMIISYLRDYRRERQRGSITDFKKEIFDIQGSFARIGGGSLGGKARGLSFVNLLINSSGLQKKFKDVHIHVPPGVILGTDVFDYFVDENNLRHYALSADNDEEITQRFFQADRFPADVVYQLSQFLDLVREPLAVRSSSLLEDSQYHPFAGVYDTYMLPNNHPDSEVRLQQLLNTVKCVYASTFYNRTKDYMNMTTYRLEEEKMAVIIQKMVGVDHENRFYPDFAGVAKSHNFYPVAPQLAKDGIIAVCMGLGKTVVEGGSAVKFSPKYPNHLPQFSSINETLNNTQKSFYALDLRTQAGGTLESYEQLLKPYPLDVAEKDGTLTYVGSTYSPQDHAISNGIARPGQRLVTFAPILKDKIFPLPQILATLLEMGRKGMGMPVEIEFACNITKGKKHPREFAVLQMRPMVLSREIERLNVEKIDERKLICKSDRVLGNGIIDEIYDIVWVDPELFQRAESRKAAQEVYEYNLQLVGQKRPYLLVGVGRWGSMDPWLGIPVKWEQISGARAIIEAGLEDIEVAPSQGSHFFQNITSFMIGYFTASNGQNGAFVDWPWLRGQTPLDSKKYTRHVRLDKPLVVKMNGHQHRGVIFKPGEE